MTAKAPHSITNANPTDAVSEATTTTEVQIGSMSSCVSTGHAKTKVVPIRAVLASSTLGDELLYWTTRIVFAAPSKIYTAATMPEDPRKARRFTIAGRVQGVGFRYFVRQQAQDLGLAGWVRNLADGRVEAFVEGSPAELDQIEARLREGPAMSRVDSVECSEAAPSVATDFVIRG
jgi:acylphosphatase